MPNPTMNIGQFVLPQTAIQVYKVSGQFQQPAAGSNLITLDIQVVIQVNQNQIATQNNQQIDSAYLPGALFDYINDQCHLGFPGFTVVPVDPTPASTNTHIYFSGSAFNVLTGGQKVEHGITAANITK